MIGKHALKPPTTNGVENCYWLSTIKLWYTKLQVMKPGEVYNDMTREDMFDILRTWSADPKTPPMVRLAARGLYHAY